MYRRVHSKPDYYSKGKDRPSGLNFLPDGDEDDVSMWITTLTSPEAMVAGHPGFGLCELPTALLFDLALTLTWEPSEGHGHVSVWGLKESNDSLRREIAKNLTKIWRPGEPVRSDNGLVRMPPRRYVAGVIQV